MLLTASIAVQHDAFAQASADDRRLVTVSGEGTVRVQPDMAVVHFGVVTTADDPETARRLNAESAREAMNTVRELGVEERFMRLEGLQLQPRREYDETARRYVERGYEASRQVVVELHDVEMLPTLVARIVQRGANRLNHVAYDLQNRDEARNEALRVAVLNAREKARMIVETLDQSLGQLRSVNEQSFDFPRPMLRMESMAMAARDAEPEPEAYAAGEIEVRAQLNVTFEIVD